MIESLTKQLHIESPTKMRVQQLAERLMNLQSNLEEEKYSRIESFQAKLKGLESKIDGSSLNFENKFKTLRDQLNKLSSTLASERASKDFLDERKTKELKLVENSLQIDLNLLKQGRKESEVKTLKFLEEKLYPIKLDMSKERKIRGEVYDQQSSQLSASIERLHSVVEEESSNRQEGLENLNNQILEEFQKFEEESMTERREREEANSALNKMLEDMQERLLQELITERNERENTEEILLKLLEETCQRVETSLRA